MENGSDDIKAQVNDSNKQKAWLSVANYGKAVTEAVIKWCEETIAALRDESETGNSR